MKKRDPSFSPVRNHPTTAIPNSLTIRKRPKQEDPPVDPSTQPFVKKQRSPPGDAVSDNNPLNYTQYNTETGKQETPIESSTLPNNNSYTQIPDSEGEDNDEFFVGEDFAFDSDLLSPVTKPHQTQSPTRVSTVQFSTISKEEHNVVPESPFRIRATTAPQVDERTTAQTGNNAALYPSLAIAPNTISDAEPGSSRSVATPCIGNTVCRFAVSANR